jgi:chaperonin GroEL
MSVKNLLFHDEARAKLCTGLNVLADAVKLTLGPRGRTVALENAYGAPTVINSGVIVARSIELPDKFENVGAQMAREVSARTSEMAGDGTTTATVLAQAIVQQGMKFVAAGFDPMDLKRGIDAAVGAVVESLKQNSRKIESNLEIEQVGTISANGDPEIGAMIAQALERVGRDGVVRAEDGRGIGNELEIVEGLQIDRGYLSPYFITDPQKGSVALDEALVLLYPKHLSSIEPLLPVLEQVVKTGQPLLIIAEEIDGEALTTLVLNSLRGTLKACAVKTPGFGELRNALLEDIAVVTGAQLIGTDVGISLDKVTLEELGRARRVEVEKESTTIIGGGGRPDDVQGRISQIRNQVKETANRVEREQLEERIAKLVGGVALIKVGASTETEMKEKKSRVEDALHATRAAVEEGIGAGGGVALLRARNAVDSLKLANMAQRAGVKIVQRALEEPLRQIVANAGGKPDMVVDAVVNGTGDFGYNAASEVYGSMTEMGVIDPTKVTRLALLNAVSIAGLILTTDCILVEESQPPDSTAGMMPGGLGL